MKELSSILGKNIYAQLRLRCRGWIQVSIKDDECIITIKFNELEYTEMYDRLAERILQGEFVSVKIVDGFIRRWRKYAITQMEKKMFYEEP